MATVQNIGVTHATKHNSNGIDQSTLFRFSMTSLSFSHLHKSRDVKKTIEVAIQVGYVVGDVGHRGVELLQLVLIKLHDTVHGGVHRLEVKVAASVERRSVLDEDDGVFGGLSYRA